jgi:uncharacterized protein YdhG (YjbR/CyaY superfamily)
MEIPSSTPKNIDEYIATFPAGTSSLLEVLRATIKSAAPDAVEVISYQMPAYKLFGMLVYFAAYEHHIGFYPGASGVVAFAEDLKGYKTSKGTVQFPLNKALPIDLITKMVQFRTTENTQKVEGKKKKK